MSRTIARLAPLASGLLGTLAAILMFALMVLTCIDVLGRYFFNRPVYGGLELTEILMAGTIFLALPLVAVRGENVMVELVRLPSRRLRMAQHVLTNIIGALVALALAQQLWLRAERFARAGETTIQIKIPLDLVAYGISLLLGVTAIAFLVRAFHPQPDSAGTPQ